MIPTGNEDFPESDFQIEEQPSKAFAIDFEKKRIVGHIDGLEAIKQTIFLILSVERYEYIIYSWNYGVEFNQLYGKPYSFVLPELKRLVYEALTQDDRILGVDAFSFEINKKKVHMQFTVNTVLGDLEIERDVSI